MEFSPRGLSSSSPPSLSLFLNRFEAKKTSVKAKLLDIVDDLFDYLLQEFTLFITSSSAATVSQTVAPTQQEQSSPSNFDIPQSVAANVIVPDQNGSPIIESLLSNESNGITSAQSPNVPPTIVENINSPQSVSSIRSSLSNEDPAATMDSMANQFLEPMLSSNNLITDKIANYIIGEAVNLFASSLNGPNLLEPPLDVLSVPSSTSKSIVKNAFLSPSIPELHLDEKDEELLVENSTLPNLDSSSLNFNLSPYACDSELDLPNSDICNIAFCHQHTKRCSSRNGDSLVCKKSNNNQTIDDFITLTVIDNLKSLNIASDDNSNNQSKNSHKPKPFEADFCTHDDFCLCEQCVLDTIRLEDEQNIDLNNVENVDDADEGSNQKSEQYSNEKQQQQKSQLKDGKSKSKQLNNKDADQENEFDEELLQLTLHFKCWHVQCRGKMYDDQADLDEHLLYVHQSLPPCDDYRAIVTAQAKPQFACVFCPKMSKTYSALYQHVYQYHQEGEYRCVHDGCLFVGRIRNDLRKHVYQLHSDRHHCPVQECKRSFSLWTNLKVHEQVHHQMATKKKRNKIGAIRATIKHPKPYRCIWNNCCYSSKQKGRVISHIQAHLDRDINQGQPKEKHELKAIDYLQVATEFNA